MNRQVQAQALEQDRQAAMLRADVDVLDTLLERDLVYIHANGVEDTKARYLADIASAAVVYRSLSLEDIRVRTASDDVIVITGLMVASIRKPTGDVAVRSRYTAVWQRRDRAWRLAVFQGTRTSA